MKTLKGKSIKPIIINLTSRTNSHTDQFASTELLNTGRKRNNTFKSMHRPIGDEADDNHEKSTSNHQRSNQNKSEFI